MLFLGIFEEIAAHLPEQGLSLLEGGESLMAVYPPGGIICG
jgi:hypothetical protein